MGLAGNNYGSCQSQHPVWSVRLVLWRELQMVSGACQCFPCTALSRVLFLTLELMHPATGSWGKELIKVENFSKLNRFGFFGSHSQCNPFQVNIKTAPHQPLVLFPFPFTSTVMLPHRVPGHFHGLSEQL